MPQQHQHLQTQLLWRYEDDAVDDYNVDDDMSKNVKIQFNFFFWKSKSAIATFQYTCIYGYKPLLIYHTKAIGREIPELSNCNAICCNFFSFWTIDSL